MKPRALVLFFFLSLGWALPAKANSVLGNPVPLQQSTALEHNHVFTGTNLYSLTVSDPAAAGFLLIYNAVAAPSDGAVTPTLCYPVASSGSLTVPVGQWPFAFPSGIVAVFSTGANCFTQTSANAFFVAQAK